MVAARPQKTSLYLLMDYFILWRTKEFNGAAVDKLILRSVINN